MAVSHSEVKTQSQFQTNISFFYALLRLNHSSLYSFQAKVAIIYTFHIPEQLENHTFSDQKSKNVYALFQTNQIQLADPLELYRAFLTIGYQHSAFIVTMLFTFKPYSGCSTESVTKNV